MQPLPSDGLAFLAPGLLHQLGNQLFAIQGCAELLPDGSDELRERLVGAAERGASALRVLRAVAGDAAPVRLPLQDAVGPLVDVVRVAVREHGHSVQWSADAAAAARAVDATAVTAALAHAARLLVETIPGGVTGAIVLAGFAEGDGCRVRVQFAPAAGALPFPIATDDLAARCRAACAFANAPSCRAIDGGLELRFAPDVRFSAKEA